MYALRARGILYVTQSIPRLAREVLCQVYNSTLNISSLYRSVNKENKRRRSYSAVSVSLQELNDLTSCGSTAERTSSRAARISARST